MASSTTSHATIRTHMSKCNQAHDAKDDDDNNNKNNNNKDFNEKDDGDVSIYTANAATFLVVSNRCIVAWTMHATSRCVHGLRTDVHVETGTKDHVKPFINEKIHPTRRDSGGIDRFV